MTRWGVIAVALWVCLTLTACGGERPDSKAEHEGGSTQADTVTLPADAAVDLTVEQLRRERRPRSVEAPGEVKLDAYQSAQVAPRIAAQVVARHARLGDSVEQGQALVTLSSVEVADAQGALVVAARDWSRVRGLGRKVVGEKRYVKAKVAYENARARLAAYGLTEAQIDGVEAGSGGRGRFDLLAPLAGTVLRDDFVAGEYVDAGHVLFKIADLSKLWVEAEVAPAIAHTVAIHSKAKVTVGGIEQAGRVVQKRPAAREDTRTVMIRIEVPRDDERSLYPGDFAQVRLNAGMSPPVLAVPEGALVSLPGQSWAVFVRVAAHKFRQHKVRLGERLGGVTVIKGVEPGTAVVTRGAFYLASELGKAGFEDED